MSKLTRISCALLALLLSFTLLVGCDPATPPDSSAPSSLTALNVTNADRVTLPVGSTLQLLTDAPNGTALTYAASNAAVTVSDTGLVTAVSEGTVAVTVSFGSLSDTVLIHVVTRDDSGTDDFYKDDLPARSHAEALARSAQGILSGLTTVPDQAPTVANGQPTQNGQLIRNTASWYADENTYIVTNAAGDEVFRVYRGGGYITLEEVAAYVFAFGDVPANYISGKNAEPENSIWGEYLRLNHSKFSGSTTKYPYEPRLPRISGCGGDLQYYEIDIGTTGTDCDPGYQVRIYNDGERITRGAARIVYARFDANGNEIIDQEEKYVFYTYNHYNDFQEYLNYYGGWGTMFGNITGGGKLSSKTDCNPTPYVVTYRAPLFVIPDDTLTDAACVILPYVEQKRALAA